jgi:hypothetical protein
MERLRLFSATLGLSPPWKLVSVGFAEQSNRMDIRVELVQNKPLVCPICGITATVDHAEARTETWFHSDFLNHATYLHVQLPPLLCPCGACLIKRPWCREGSRFARVS